MTDIQKLKALAEAAQYENHQYQQTLVVATRKFFEACIPEQILQLIAEREQLKAENDALRKDAERYQWLRDKSESIHQFYLSTPIWFTGVKFSKKNVDSTIDAAMSKESSHG